MELWSALLDVLVLLLAALLLGALCERLRQNAVLGYLLAGALLGPNALNLMSNHADIAVIAELGVALLLFAIGLEVSWRRLRAIGPIALGGGSLQVVATLVLAAAVCLAFGLSPRVALAIGAVVSLSSTACVLRVLVSRAEIDAIHGRNALGILLLQDIAVVPLVLLVTVLGDRGSPAQAAWDLARALGAACGLIVVTYGVLRYAAPLLLNADIAAKNRELPILLAIITAVGASWAAHRLGLSPALGAFVAGTLLAESPFATQIRSDVSSLRTLFVTLFFSSIGMLADPSWAAAHWAQVLTVIVAVVLGKGLLISGVARVFRASWPHAIATGLCLAQIGEFSFVLAEAARERALLSADLFNLMVSATIVTLFLTPYLVALAPRAALAVGRRLSIDPAAMSMLDGAVGDEAQLSNHVLIIGFGPAGRRVAEDLMRRHKSRLVVLELSRKSADIGRSYGLRTYLGDGAQVEVLEHLAVARASAIVVTIPDPATAHRVISAARALAPGVPIIARARYHVYRWEMIVAGAEVVVDEEDHVGVRIAAAVRRRLRPTAAAD